MARLGLLLCLCVVAVAYADKTNYHCETYQYDFHDAATFKSLIASREVTVDFQDTNLNQALSVETDNSGLPLPFRVAIQHSHICREGAGHCSGAQIDVSQRATPNGFYPMDGFNVEPNRPIQVEVTAGGGKLFYVYCNP